MGFKINYTFQYKNIWITVTAYMEHRVVTGMNGIRYSRDVHVSYDTLIERIANSLYYRNIYWPTIFLFLICVIAILYPACKWGYRGTDCETKCLFPSYGEDCQFICNCNKTDCDHAVGCKGINIKNTWILFCVYSCFLVVVFFVLQKDKFGQLR